MRKTFFLIILLLFIISTHLFAQITAEDFYSQRDSLTIKKNALTTEIKVIKADIDSLQKVIPLLDQEVTTAYRELYVLKYGKKIGERVAYKRIWKGMTEEMVKDGWGEPDLIEKNVEKWGVFTQWHYGEIIFFFRDGKLTDWEEGN